MSTQLYKITRRGVLFVRREWPDGTPVKGSHLTKLPNGRQVPAERNGGKAVLRYYGTKGVMHGGRLYTPTGHPVSQTIRLTREQYVKKRYEWGLEIALIGIDTLPNDARIEHKPIVDPNPIDEGEGGSVSSDEEQGGIAPPAARVKQAAPVEIPANWRSMNQSALSKIVSEIYQQPYKSLPKEQAVALIEAYIEDAKNGGET